jgi:hypothetical protein
MKKIESPMDLPQDQVSLLTLKVDSLHQIIEHLSNQTAAVLAELQDRGGQPSNFGAMESSSSVRYPHSRLHFDGEMEHKDVLADGHFIDNEPQSGDRSLSPEVQVQRLTAQLTAAYNRIAALEEQLLSKRITAQGIL